MTTEGFRFVEGWLDRLPDLPVLVTVSLLVLTVVTRFTLRKGMLVRSRVQKNVPEPFAWPIIGHLHLIGKLPHQSMMKLARRYGPLMSLRLGSLRVLVASSAEMAKEILKTQDAVWASRPPSLFSEIVVYNGSDMAMQPLNDLWRKMRKIFFSELLSTTNVEKQMEQRHESIMRMVNSLLASTRGDELVDIHAAVANMNFYILTKLTFGKSFSLDYTACTSTGEKRTLPQLIDHIATVNMLSLADCFPRLRWLDLDGAERKMKTIHGEFDTFLSQVLEERRRQLLDGDEDDDSRDFSRALLSMLDKEDASGLTYDNIKSALVDVFLAGIETTAALVTFTIAEILRHPDVKEKLVKELDYVVGHERLVNESDLVNLNYLKMVIKESLRLHPPLPLLVYHHSIAPSVLAGYQIPAGTTVLINAYAIQRDPELWEESLAFKPERFSDNAVDVKGQHFELLSFGSGRRSCPGMNMGLITGEMVLARLFHTLDIRLRPGMKPKDVDMTERIGAATNLLNPLKVVVSPRLPRELYSI